MASRTDPAFVGRRAELSAIEDVVASSGAPGGAVLIRGVAGIGKTRLLAEAVQHATDRGYTVFSAAGDELEQPRAYGVLHEAFDDAITARAGASHERLLAAIDEMTACIEHIGQSGPVAVCIDDLHWVDDETLRVLRAAVRRMTTAPFLFIGAQRSAVTNDDLDALEDAIANAGGLRLDLTRLDDSDIAVLVRQLLGADASGELNKIVSSAQGSPFFAIELSSSQRDGEALPDDLRRTILRRVGSLSDGAQSVVRLASLLGSAFDASDLEVLAGRSTIELVPAVNEAIRGDVLEDRGDVLAFRHDLVHEAVYTDIPQALRRQLHQQAGRALADAVAPARRVAVHLAAGATRGDEEAISWLRRAAAEEVIFSPGASADLLARAVELIDPVDPRIDRFNADRARALALAGRVAEAESIARDVLTRLDDPFLEGELRTALAESLFFQGRFAETSNEIERAAEISQPRLRGLRMAQAALAAVTSGQIERGAELVTKAFEVATEPSALSLANSVLATVQGLRGERDAIPNARKAITAASEDPSGQAHRYGAHSSLGLLLNECDDFDDAARVLNRGIELDRARGVAWATPIYHGGLAVGRFYAGAWVDAVAELVKATPMIDDMGSQLFAPLFHGVLGAIAFHRGDIEQAEREIVLGDEAVATTGPQAGIEWCIYTRAQVLHARGEIEPAYAIVLGACHLARAAGLLIAFRYFGPLAVQLSLAKGDEQAARACVNDLDAFAANAPSPTAKGVALRCRGMLERDVSVLLDAVDHLREGRRPFDFAAACESAAEVLHANGDDARARELFAEAVRTYERIGAAGDASRVAKSMGGSGRARGRPGPSSGWSSLSTTERKVAAFVSEGLSNRAIADRMVVSRRTVETHVYHLFQKLGVSSRVELALKASKEPEQPYVQ